MCPQLDIEDEMFLRSILTLWSLAFLRLQTVTGAESQCVCVEITTEWDGNYKGLFSVETTIDFTGLRVNLTFNDVLDNFEYYSGHTLKVDDTHYYLTDERFQGSAGELVTFDFHVVYSGEKPLVVEAYMNWEDVCDGSGDWSTPTPMVNPCDPTGMLPYDYSQVLCLSYLFYEAQRSGPLPPDNRVTWRGDSALDDGSDVGIDLTGGYYDAGDHVKFGFPMAFSTTMLAWGLIDFAEGHEIAGQTEYGLAAVKWATDYFLKAHTASSEFYGQVGEGNVDHGYWGRPEDMTMERPSMKIDSDKPALAHRHQLPVRPAGLSNSQDPTLMFYTVPLLVDQLKMVHT